MRALVKLGPVAALLLLSTACAAGKATYHLVQANQAVERARDQGADDRAPYPFTMSEQYLDKAREEAASSDFKVSVQLAKQSAEWADRSIIAMRSRSLDGEPGDLTQRPEPPPPPPPEPAPTVEDAPEGQLAPWEEDLIEKPAEPAPPDEEDPWDFEEQTP